MNLTRLPTSNFTLLAESLVLPTLSDLSIKNSFTYQIHYHTKEYAESRDYFAFSCVSEVTFGGKLLTIFATRKGLHANSLLGLKLKKWWKKLLKKGCYKLFANFQILQSIEDNYLLFLKKSFISEAHSSAMTPC